MKNSRLKQFRERTGLDMKAFADAIGMSYSTYAKIEEGYRNMSYGLLVKIKKKFPDADINELIFTE